MSAVTLINKNIKTEKEIEKEGQKLIKRLNLKHLLITRSEKGMSIISPTTKIDIPTQAKEVFDITGAGDTVIATLTLGLTTPLSIENASHTANIAAGIVVGKIGTSSVSIDEIKEKLPAIK